MWVVTIRGTPVVWQAAPVRGHSVLQVPIPELEAFIVARTRHYDEGFLSADPDFAHAHITALAPFLADPSPADLSRVGEIAAATAPFEAELATLAQFPNGIIHLRPEPQAPFAALTTRLFEEFPSCPPYAGAYPGVVPHLTLDQACDRVDLASTRSLLGDLVPITTQARQLQLAWYESGNCRVLASWALAGP